MERRLHRRRQALFTRGKFWVLCGARRRGAARWAVGVPGVPTRPDLPAPHAVTKTAVAVPAIPSLPDHPDTSPPSAGTKRAVAVPVVASLPGLPATSSPVTRYPEGDGTSTCAAMADGTRPSQLQQLLVLRPIVVLNRLTSEDIAEAHRTLLESSRTRGSQVWRHTRSSSATSAANAAMPSPVPDTSAPRRRSDSGVAQKSRGSVGDAERKPRARKRVISFSEHRKRNDKKRLRLSTSPSPPASGGADREGANAINPVAVPAYSGATTVSPIPSRAPAPIAAKARISTDAKRPRPDRRKSREMLSAMEDKETGCLFSPDVVTTHYARRPSHEEGAVKPTGKQPAGVDPGKHSSKELQTCASQRTAATSVKSCRPDAVATSAPSGCGPVKTTPGERNGTVVAGKIIPSPRPSLEKESPCVEAARRRREPFLAKIRTGTSSAQQAAATRVLPQAGEGSDAGRSPRSGNKEEKIKRKCIELFGSDDDFEPTPTRKRTVTTARVRASESKDKGTATGGGMTPNLGTTSKVSTKSGGGHKEMGARIGGPSEKMRPATKQSAKRLSSGSSRESIDSDCVIVSEEGSEANLENRPLRVFSGTLLLPSHFVEVIPSASLPRLRKATKDLKLKTGKPQAANSSMSIVVLDDSTTLTTNVLTCNDILSTPEASNKTSTAVVDAIPFQCTIFKKTANGKFIKEKQQTLEPSVRVALETTTLKNSIKNSAEKSSTKNDLQPAETACKLSTPLTESISTEVPTTKKEVFKERSNSKEGSKLSTHAVEVNSKLGRPSKITTHKHYDPLVSNKTFQGRIPKKLVAELPKSNAQKRDTLSSISINPSALPLGLITPSVVRPSNISTGPSKPRVSPQGVIPKKLVPKSIVVSLPLPAVLQHNLPTPSDSITPGQLQRNNAPFMDHSYSASADISLPQVPPNVSQEVNPEKSGNVTVEVTEPQAASLDVTPKISVSVIPKHFEQKVATSAVRQAESPVPRTIPFYKQRQHTNKQSVIEQPSSVGTTGLSNPWIPCSASQDVPLNEPVDELIITVPWRELALQAPPTGGQVRDVVESRQVSASPELVPSRSATTAEPLVADPRGGLSPLFGVQVGTVAPLEGNPGDGGTEAVLSTTAAKLAPKTTVVPLASLCKPIEKKPAMSVPVLPRPSLDNGCKPIATTKPATLVLLPTSVDDRCHQIKEVPTASLPPTSVDDHCRPVATKPKASKLSKATTLPSIPLDVRCQPIATKVAMPDFPKATAIPSASLDARCQLVETKPTVSEPTKATALPSFPLVGQRQPVVKKPTVSEVTKATASPLASVDSHLRPTVTKPTTLELKKATAPQSTSLDNRCKSIPAKTKTSEFPKETALPPSLPVPQYRPIAPKPTASEKPQSIERLSFALDVWSQRIVAKITMSEHSKATALPSSSLDDRRKSIAVRPPTSLDTHCKPIVTKPKTPELPKSTAPPSSSIVGKCKPIATKVTASEDQKATSAHQPTSLDNQCQTIVTKPKTPELPKSTALSPSFIVGRCEPIAANVAASEHLKATSVRPPTSLDNQCKSIVMKPKVPELPKAIVLPPSSMDNRYKPVAANLTALEHPRATSVLPPTSLDNRGKPLATTGTVSELKKATALPSSSIVGRCEPLASKGAVLEHPKASSVLPPTSLDNRGKPVATKMAVSDLKKATSNPSSFIVGPCEPIATNVAVSEHLKATSVRPPTSLDNQCKSIVMKPKVPELPKAIVLPPSSMDNRYKPVAANLTALEHQKATSVNPPTSLDNQCKPIVMKPKAPELPKASAFTPPSMDNRNKPLATKVTASEHPQETALPPTSLDNHQLQPTATRPLVPRICDDQEGDEDLSVDDVRTRQRYNVELQNAVRFAEDFISKKTTVVPAPLVTIPAGNLLSLKDEPAELASDVCEAYVEDTAVSLSAGSVDGGTAASSIQALGDPTVSNVVAEIPASGTSEVPGVPAVKTCKTPSVPRSSSVATPTETRVDRMLLPAAVRSPSPPRQTLPDVPIDETCVDFEQLLSSHLVDVSTFASAAVGRDPLQEAACRRRRTVLGGLESIADAEAEPSSPRPLPPSGPEATKNSRLDEEERGERKAMRGSPKPISRGMETDDSLGPGRLRPTSRDGSVAASSPSPRLPDNLESYGEVVGSAEAKGCPSQAVGSSRSERPDATLRDPTPSVPYAAEEFMLPVIVGVTSLRPSADDAPAVEMEAVSDTVASSFPRPSAEGSATLVAGTHYDAGSTAVCTAVCTAVVSRAETSPAANRNTSAEDPTVLSDCEEEEDDVVCLDLNQPHAIFLSRPPPGLFRRDSDSGSEPEVVDLDSDDDAIPEPVPGVGGRPVIRDELSAAGELTAELPAAAGNHLVDETGRAERNRLTENGNASDSVHPAAKDDNAKDIRSHASSATGSGDLMAQLVAEVAAVKRDLESFLAFGERLPGMISPLPGDAENPDSCSILAGVDDLRSFPVPVETVRLPPIADPAGTDYPPSLPVPVETEDLDTCPVLADSIIPRSDLLDKSPSNNSLELSSPTIQTTVPVELAAPVVQKTVILPPPAAQLEAVEMCVPLKHGDIVSVPLAADQPPSIDNAVAGLSTMPALLQQTVELSTPVVETASDVPQDVKEEPAALKPMLESWIVPTQAARLPVPASAPVKEMDTLLEGVEAVAGRPVGSGKQESDDERSGSPAEEADPSTDRAGPSTMETSASSSSASLVGTVRVKPLSGMLNPAAQPSPAGSTVPPPQSAATSGTSTLATAAPAPQPTSPSTSRTPPATQLPPPGTLPTTAAPTMPSQAPSSPASTIPPPAASLAPPPPNIPATAATFSPSAILALANMADYLVELGDLFVHALERPETASLRDEVRARAVANHPLFRSWHETLLRTRLSRGELRDSVCEAVRLRTAQQDCPFTNRMTVALCRVAADVGFLDQLVGSVALRHDRRTGRVDVRFLRPASPLPPSQPAAAEPSAVAGPPPLVRLGPSNWPQHGDATADGRQPAVSQPPQQVPMPTALHQPATVPQVTVHVREPNAPQDLTVRRQQPDVQRPPLDFPRPSLRQPPANPQPSVSTHNLPTDLPHQQPGMPRQDPTTSAHPSAAHQQPGPQDRERNVQRLQPRPRVPQPSVTEQHPTLTQQLLVAPVPSGQHQQPQPNVQHQHAPPPYAATPHLPAPQQLSPLSRLAAQLAARLPRANQPPTELDLLERSIHHQKELLVELRLHAPSSHSAELAMKSYREQLLAYMKLSKGKEAGGSGPPPSQPRSEVDPSRGKVPGRSRPPPGQADPGGTEAGSMPSQPPVRNPPAAAHALQVAPDAAAETVAAPLQHAASVPGFGLADEREISRRLELQRAGNRPETVDTETPALRRTQQLYEQQQLQFQQRQQQQQHVAAQQQLRRQEELQLQQRRQEELQLQQRRQEELQLQQRRQKEEHKLEKRRESQREYQERKEHAWLQKEHQRQQQQLKAEQQQLLLQQQNVQRMLDDLERKEKLQRLDHERQQMVLQLQHLQKQQDKSAASAAWQQHQGGGVCPPVPAPLASYPQLQQQLLQQQQSRFTPPQEYVHPPHMPGYYNGAAVPNVNPFQGNQTFLPRHHSAPYAFPTSSTVCSLNEYVTTAPPPVPAGYPCDGAAYATRRNGQAGQPANATARWGDAPTRNTAWNNRVAEFTSESPTRRLLPGGGGGEATTRGRRSSQDDGIRLMPPAIPIPRCGGGGRGRGRGRRRERRRNSAPLPPDPGSLPLGSGTARRADEGGEASSRAVSLAAAGSKLPAGGSRAATAATDKRRASLDSLIQESRSVADLSRPGDLASTPRGDSTEVPGVCVRWFASSSTVATAVQEAGPDVSGVAAPQTVSKEVGGTSRPSSKEGGGGVQDKSLGSSGTGGDSATVSLRNEITSSRATSPTAADCASLPRRQGVGSTVSGPGGRLKTGHR